MMAAASWLSSRSCPLMNEPRPTGSPATTTSTTPPRVSPSFLAASISLIIEDSACASKARTGLASMAARSAASGTGPSYGSESPMEMTCEMTSTPRACLRKALARVPTATRAAVSRALARSSTGRASSNPYLSMPA
ncbi:Uncharacterised protein [Mycobacteroides abscessus subsp. abscessus]|nr:Uncharacterised protein [Mycobacteroides abscessus subsp. abscessus]